MDAVALPVSALSGAVGVAPLVAVAALTMAAAIGCASAGSPAVRVCGAVLGGLLALVLVTCNGTVPVWEGLTILAVVFLGTAVYRAERGESSRRSAAGAAAVVVVCLSVRHRRCRGG
ncbi:FtsH-binding integral membrane protein [Streptomyces sp. SAI-117]|uniref:hypothetical protein n=1 Tax=Streptomyces sp. SAI-117 TaxID=2940546 RepID=UPI00247B6E6B|nr:FtsH-binding integral membrane protein [Streptomyces sp. SAI-117]